MTSLGDSHWVHCKHFARAMCQSSASLHSSMLAHFACCAAHHEPTSSRPAALSLPAPQSKLSNTQIAIFSDENSSVPQASVVGKWTEFPSERIASKENTQGASKWSQAEPITQRSTVCISKIGRSDIQVFEDGSGEDCRSSAPKCESPPLHLLVRAPIEIDN